MNRAVVRSEIFSKDEDYSAFEEILAEMQLRIPIRILGWCLMPNHWHLVVWPEEGAQVSEFLRLVTGTHVQRWHAAHGTQGTGALYQGRFKACAVENGRYLRTVLRYVERNPLRANLVERAESWPWSSLGPRLGQPAPSEALRPRLTPSPAPLADPWLEYVQKPLTDREYAKQELSRLRRSVETGLPFGSDTFLNATLTLLGLESLLAPRGRPRKEEK